MKKILISTGGSGGHVIPATILFDHYKENFETFLTTDKRGEKYIDQKKYVYDIIDVPKLSGNIFKLPFNLIFLLFSFFKSLIYLKKHGIEYLFSTGGYMSAVFCIAAKILNVKIFLYEPNMVLGKSNKFFLKYAKKIICYSNNIKKFPEKYNSKIFLTDSLLRKSIYKNKLEDKIELKNTFKILVLGGSQGAKFFDEEVSKLLISLSKINKIYLIQQVSNKNVKEELSRKYNEIGLESEVFEFSDDIYQQYNKVDFAITRAGASTISELIFCNIPFLAIPFPYAKDNHQYYNAKEYHDKNLCWLINQNNFDANQLLTLISGLIIRKEELILKKNNMKKFSHQNTWKVINQKFVGLINEN
tara:strand:- start:328 stop:1404 length:1077 start_codon:yes stop_codon:yes gene_type:complete